VHQVIAVPLHVGAAGDAAIALFLPGPQLSPPLVRHVHDLAAHAAVVVANAEAHAAAKNRAAQLVTAMQSRATIDQATGVLMARYPCSPEEALALLGQRSQDTDRTLLEVAADVVSARAEAPATEQR
jgi:AmiR/NasT family two-component response regulator